MTQGREMNHWMALLLASVTLGAAPVRNEAALPGTQALDWPSDGKGIVFCESDSRLWLANSELGIEFLQAGDGLRLSRLVGRQQGGDFLASNSRRAAGGFWQLVLRRDRGRDGHEVTVSSRDAATVSSRCEGGPAERTLRLRWQGLAVADEPNALDAEVTVALSANSPLSRWRIAVTNRSRTWGLWKVLFPSIALAPIGGDPAKNYLTLGRARGIVVRDPFQPTNGPAFGVSSSTGLNWPGSLNMQFQALYASDGAGFYLATHDGGGFKKTFYVLPQRGQPALDYQVGHWPANMGWPAEDFHLSYDVCLGPFRGDWFDACQLYRQWATRQAWCACGPRAMRRDVPRWFKESPAAFYLMNYYGESQVPMFRQRIGDYSRLLGVELPVTWYVWKKHVPEMTDYNRPGSPWRVPEARAYPCGNIHDGNYPRLPALPSFGEACRSVAAQGAHVQAYVCAQIYDPGLNENAPYAAEARPSVIRDVHGELQAAERNKVGWLMCGRTKWWQQRLAETVTELVHREHVGGIYFDTFYGGYVQCFDTSHGHSHGGGRDPYLADRELSTVVRGAMKRAAPEAVMTGENPAETAIDLLDGFLYRWTMWPDMQPLLATVYGDYICRHGMQLDVASDAFWGQAAVLFTEGAQMGWFPLHGGTHYLEGFEAGSKSTEKMRFFRKLARHWRLEAGGRYLAYGRLLRPLRFAEPSPLPMVTFTDTSIGPYQDGRITVPALMSGVFKAADADRLAVFIVNVSDRPIAFRFELTPDRYPLAASQDWRASRISQRGERLRQGEPTRGRIAWNDRLVGHDVMFLEVCAGSN